MKEDKTGSSYSGAAGILVVLGRSGKIILVSICVALMPIFLQVITFSAHHSNPLMSILMTVSIGVPLIFALAVVYFLCVNILNEEVAMARAAIRQQDSWDEDVDGSFFACILLSTIFVTLGGAVSLVATYFFRLELAKASLIGLAICGLSVLLAILVWIISLIETKRGRRQSLLRTTRNFAHTDEGYVDMYTEAKKIALEVRNAKATKSSNNP